MAKKAQIKALTTGPVDCACVIHGKLYDWVYVDKLYAMLTRHFTRPVVLHVFTESDRPVPEPYVKHSLINWPGIGGPRKSWWYKMHPRVRIRGASPSGLWTRRLGFSCSQASPPFVP